jgi:hypothetical protein
MNKKVRIATGAIGAMGAGLMPALGLGMAPNANATTTHPSTTGKSVRTSTPRPKGILATGCTGSKIWKHTFGDGQWLKFYYTMSGPYSSHVCIGTIETNDLVGSQSPGTVGVHVQTVNGNYCSYKIGNYGKGGSWGCHDLFTSAGLKVWASVYELHCSGAQPKGWDYGDAKYAPLTSANWTPQNGGCTPY